MDKDVVCVYTYTHTHTMEYYSVKKKNEIMPFATTWMDLEIIILNEVSQKEKDKYYMISLIYGILNMTQMNLPMKQKQTHRQNGLVVAKREVSGKDGLGVWD